MYLALCEYTGKKLPWGTLTGIRPTKIAVTNIEHGFSDSMILDYYKNVYLTSEQKARLSIDIAHREIDILSDIHYFRLYGYYP